MWVWLTRIPYGILGPVILLLAFLGAYSRAEQHVRRGREPRAAASIGYVLRKYQWPLAPLLLSFILGPLLEKNLIQSLSMSGGSLLIFVQRGSPCRCLSRRGAPAPASLALMRAAYTVGGGSEGAELSGSMQGGHRAMRRHGGRLLVWLTAGLAALAGLASAAAAQQYPTRPVEIVVPFVPGGGTDLIARATADYLSKKWGQPILVVNKPGGGGVTGARAALKDCPARRLHGADGHPHHRPDDDRRVEDAAAHPRRPQVGGADRARSHGLRRQDGRAVEGPARSSPLGQGQSRPARLVQCRPVGPVALHGLRLVRPDRRGPDQDQDGHHRWRRRLHDQAGRRPRRARHPLGGGGQGHGRGRQDQAARRAGAHARFIHFPTCRRPRSRA